MKLATPSLLVIRSADIHRSIGFYEQLGLSFVLHSHGRGPEHYAAEVEGFVFEIYPKSDPADNTSRTRLGFHVEDVDATLSRLRTLDVKVLAVASDSPWGRRAVVEDFDGHAVELVSV